MQKIPSLFKRDYEGTRRVYNEVVEGCEWVLAGEGKPTEKFDGTSCLLENGKLYKRYDAKAGKTPPTDFIPAQSEPDEVTGHWPGWLPVGDGNEDKWHVEAYNHFLMDTHTERDFSGTYELVGPKVQSNPYKLSEHILLKHGSFSAAVNINEPPRDYEGLKAWFEEHAVEGIVWHHPDGRMCKIKRRDFGLPWPIK